MWTYKIKWKTLYRHFTSLPSSQTMPVDNLSFNISFDRSVSEAIRTNSIEYLRRPILVDQGVTVHWNPTYCALLTNNIIFEMKNVISTDTIRIITVTMRRIANLQLSLGKAIDLKHLVQLRIAAWRTFFLCILSLFFTIYFIAFLQFILSLFYILKLFERTTIVSKKNFQS